MQCRLPEWRKIVFIYIFQLFSYATHATVHVQLRGQRYVKYRDTAELFCDHNVTENDLHKIEFIRGSTKILQYVKGRKPPLTIPPLEGAEVEYNLEEKTLRLKNVSFEVSGNYFCEVSTATPIYTKASNKLQLQVIVPQAENPEITFKKAVYTVGEYLEANCSSSPAYPVPHLTWFINGKEVDIMLVTLYPHRSHGNKLLSSTSKLKIKVSELHVGDNGRLEISCNATIPDYPVHHRVYADSKSKTVTVKIIPAPANTAASVSVSPHRAWTLTTITCVLYATYKIIPL